MDEVTVTGTLSKYSERDYLPDRVARRRVEVVGFGKIPRPAGSPEDAILSVRCQRLTPSQVAEFADRPLVITIREAVAGDDFPLIHRERGET